MKKYTFKLYKKESKDLFTAEKNRISSTIDALIIEHVGSTSIPGLGGKGIIDIAIGARREDFKKVSLKLNELGYVFRNSASTNNRFFFRENLPADQRKYHIHLMTVDCFDWYDFIFFRDHLSTCQEEFLEYEKLKKEAARLFQDDGYQYRKYKEPFFKKIHQKRIKKQVTFRAVEKEDKDLIVSWLNKPHIGKWFYGQGLKNTLKLLDEYINGSKDCMFWIGVEKKHPFVFFITSNIDKPTDALTKYCELSGDAICMDVAIGDTDYIGRGLGSTLIQQFLNQMFSKIDEVLIDPEKTNLQAINAYQKAGFEIIEDFIPPHSPHTHLMMHFCKDQNI